MTQWIVIGISGVTCGGKSTLTKALFEELSSSKYNNIISYCQIISQDDYFWSIDSPQHTWIEELNHINWEILGSLNINKMQEDILQIITPDDSLKSDSECSEHDNENKGKINVLLLDGFLIMNYLPIKNLCNIKFYIDLCKKDCFDRRRVRVYDPPDVPNYFDLCVWPEHLKNKLGILEDISINILDGMRNNLLDQVMFIIQPKLDLIYELNMLS